MDADVIEKPRIMDARFISENDNSNAYLNDPTPLHHRQSRQVGHSAPAVPH